MQHFPEDQTDQIQVSQAGDTVRVHAMDGSTVGRFSKRFGLDVHTTATQQLEGESQCLHCTHEKPSRADWETFCDLMEQHHGIVVDKALVKFEVRKPSP